MANLLLAQYKRQLVSFLLNNLNLMSMKKVLTRVFKVHGFGVRAALKIGVSKYTQMNGEFAIGSIQTPIGEFSVKQSVLDEYEEGKGVKQDDFKAVKFYQKACGLNNGTEVYIKSRSFCMKTTRAKKEQGVKLGSPKGTGKSK
jgi:hypothetical protein